MMQYPCPHCGQFVFQCELPRTTKCQSCNQTFWVPGGGDAPALPPVDLPPWVSGVIAILFCNMVRVHEWLWLP